MGTGEGKREHQNETRERGEREKQSDTKSIELAARASERFSAQDISDRSTMKTTKGAKVMNHTDAYRKELRKKELKRVRLATQLNP